MLTRSVEGALKADGGVARPADLEWMVAKMPNTAEIVELTDTDLFDVEHPDERRETVETGTLPQVVELFATTGPTGGLRGDNSNPS